MPRTKRIEGLQVDERDLEILRLLEHDARMPWRQLARKLGVSEATIYVRVKRLFEKGIVKGFSVKINAEALGLKFHAFLLVKVKTSGYERITRLLRGRKYVSRVYEITGQHNLLIEIVARSRDDMLSLIDELRGTREVEDILVLSVIRRVWEAKSVIGDILGMLPGVASATG